MDPEDWLPADILQLLIKAQNAYVNAASLSFGLLAQRVKGGVPSSSCQPHA